MAAVSRAVVCPDGDNRMTNKPNNSLTPVAQEAGGLPARTNKTPVAHQPGRPPVRVKLRRINANFAKAYPPDGESKVWWKRLKKALGTMSMPARTPLLWRSSLNSRVAAAQSGGRRRLQAAARLLKAYSTQVEALRRLRHGGNQYVRVEHVNVNDGGQAIIGNVKTAGPGAAIAGSPAHSVSGVIAPGDQDY